MNYRKQKGRISELLILAHNALLDDDIETLNDIIDAAYIASADLYRDMHRQAIAEERKHG